MRKLFYLFSILLLACGCTHIRNDKVFEQAKNMIRSNEAECVVIQDGCIAAVERGRGVSPLLNLYDNNKKVLKSATVVDKVIGRAAAFIVIGAEASVVYGKIMSEDAMELLEKHGIECHYDLLVPKILNRKRDGLCPLEDSVKTCNDSDSALKNMRKRIAELRQGKMN